MFIFSHFLLTFAELYAKGVELMDKKLKTIWIYDTGRIV